MKTNVKLYTIKHIAEQLALLEEHLKEFSQGKEEIFCLDCETKHILLLSGYAKECIGFVCEPKSLITDIKKWADNLVSRLNKLTKEQVLEVAAEARDFRKELGKEIVKKSTVVSHSHLH